MANCNDPNRTQNFTYDSLNRIASAYTSGPNWGETYTIDAWGNLTNIGSYAGRQSELLNAPALANNQLTGYLYDSAGNMIQNGNVTYSYDAENRLTFTSAGNYSYGYDGDGRRVKKYTGIFCLSSCLGPNNGNPNSFASGTEYWYGTGSDALTETDYAGTLTNEYVMFNGKRTARRSTAGVVAYYFGDHLGSMNVVTDASGNCLQGTDFYPYGGVASTVCGTDSNAYKFTGKERDSESGLDMFGARYYGSSPGRFMTPDWAAKPTNVPYAMFGDPQSLNLYSYVRNNPLAKADADGHCGEDACVIEGSAALLYIGGAALITGTAAVLNTPAGQRSLSTFTSAAGQSISDSVGAIEDFFSPKQSQSNPWQGKPGETVQTTRPDGTPQQTRRYGPDGYPETDVDHSPHHGQPDPHAHDIGRPADGSPPTAADRGPGRNVQPGDPQQQQQQQPQTQPQQQVQPQPPPPPPPQQKEPH